MLSQVLRDTSVERSSVLWGVAPFPLIFNLSKSKIGPHGRTPQAVTGRGGPVFYSFLKEAPFAQHRTRGHGPPSEASFKRPKHKTQLGDLPAHTAGLRALTTPPRPPLAPRLRGRP